MVAEQPHAQQNDASELELMLDRQQYNPDKLIQESSGEAGDDTFYSPEPSDDDSFYRQSRIAMIVPSKRKGMIQSAALAFQEGFQHAVETGGELVELFIYSTDGTPEEALLSHDHATEQGFDIIVGPMLKSSVQEVLQKRRDAKATTLVTQPVDVFHFDKASIYGISIGYEEEARMLARSVLTEGSFGGVIVVEENNPFGGRIAANFASEWERLTGHPPQNILVSAPDNLVTLHNRLRDIAKSRAESEIPALPPLVFAAGNRDFVLKVRAHTPGLFRLHALSIINEERNISGGTDISVLGMNNVHIIEMPWIVDSEANLVVRYESPGIRRKTLLEQRFFALGIDSYRIISQRFCWKVGCSTEGVSGVWTIPEGQHNFERRGISASFVNGVLERADS